MAARKTGAISGVVNKPGFRKGALTRAVGGKPGKNMAKVNQLAKSPGRVGREARYYKNVLRPASKGR